MQEKNDSLTNKTQDPRDYGSTGNGVLVRHPCGTSKCRFYPDTFIDMCCSSSAYLFSAQLELSHRVWTPLPNGKLASVGSSP